MIEPADLESNIDYSVPTNLDRLIFMYKLSGREEIDIVMYWVSNQYRVVYTELKEITEHILISDKLKADVDLISCINEVRQNTAKSYKEAFKTAFYDD